MAKSNLIFVAVMWSLFVKTQNIKDNAEQVNLKDRFGPSFEPFEPFDPFKPLEPSEPFKPFKPFDSFEPFNFRIKWIKRHLKATKKSWEDMKNLHPEYYPDILTKDKCPNSKKQVRLLIIEKISLEANKYFMTLLMNHEPDIIEMIFLKAKKYFMTLMYPEPDITKQSQIEKTTMKLKNREEIVEREDLDVLVEICLNTNDFSLCEYLLPYK